ncbi:hypothetical protein BJF90_36730 [Pseudonocardia sp. CNS-004]|nr:hypothetical protein BJF90_36730 [Pseudonocardia sp. CNS-004]
MFGGIAVAAVTSGLAVLLFGQSSVPALLVVAAGGLAGFVAGRATVVDVPAPRIGLQLRSRAAARERSVDDRYLEGELRARWRQAAEGTGLARLVWPASGPAVSVPVVLSVRLRPYRVLMVRLRPGQLVGDVVAVQERLRRLMDARAIRISEVARDVVRVELW